MRYLPLFVDLADAPVVLVGGNSAAAQKARLLLRAGARLTVLAPDIGAELATLVRQRDITWQSRLCQEADLHGQALMVIADAAPDLTNQLAEAARRLRIPVNVVDQANLSTAIMPGIVDRDPILVAIHSAGTAPLLVREIRAKIEALLPAKLGDVARFAARFRQAAKTAIPDALQRRRFWEEFFRSDSTRLLLSGKTHAATRAMLRALNRADRPQPAGHVALVGVGPGDPELLTLKAQRFMQEADVVLHDALIPAEIFEHVRRDATRIDVGKRRGRHRCSQTEIHALMRRHAKAGQRVVRLKGGDPFLFGRGGEEIAALRADGIAVDVVPGITAAIGAAAATAIPLTHRGTASAVTFLTGHQAQEDASLNPALLGDSQQTLVVYMGLARARAVRDACLKAGRDPSTPVAIIENATQPQQKLVRGRLDALEELTQQAHFTGPVLFIIGAVAALPDSTAITRSDALQTYAYARPIPTPAAAQSH